jgi:elongation factor P
MISGNQIRPGMLLQHEGDVWLVMESVHRTPGNLRAFMQVKMRNIRTGMQSEFRFATSDRVEKVTLETHKMQFLYQDGEDYHFMNQENYEQTHMNKEQLGDMVNFLLPEAVLDIQYFEGKPIGIQLPKTMDFKVIDAEPSVKKQTASASYKSATIETGLTIKVPAFVEKGDVIRIDPETHEYMERVTK